MSEEIGQEEIHNLLEPAENVSVAEPEVLIYYYAGEGFYRSDLMGTAAANGFSLEDLTEISEEDYNAWFNPPEGKYGAWVDGKPVLTNIPAPDYQEIAVSKRKILLDEATQAITVWQTKLLMGRKLTDAETTSLNAWMDYIDVLNDTDISDAPDVEWPTKPIN